MSRSLDRPTPVALPPQTADVSEETRSRLADGLVVLLLFTIAVGYLASLPRSLGWADESFFLYEAKRIRDGEVMYRDIFQFIPPLSAWTMALLFWAFGTTIAAARVTIAVVHGLTGVFVYLTCRQLGVRRPIAVLAPLAYLVICQPAWPYASWHWFSTNLSTLLLLVLLATPWPTRPRFAAVPGLVAGFLLGMQHQKGTVMAAGTCAVFCLDHIAGRVFGQRDSWRRLAGQMLWFLGAASLVAVPVLALSVALAGAEPVYDALVRFPLETYRQHFHVRWGQVAPLTEPVVATTFPVLLRFAPVAALIPLARMLASAARRRDRDGLRQRLALTVLSAASVASIWYFPDAVHIAFIGPVFLVCAADGLEWIVTLAGPTRRAEIAAAALATTIVALLAVRLYDNAVEARHTFPIAHETAFGRIDFASRWEPVLIDRVRVLLARSPSREIFCYPNLSEPYLTTGGKNPTRFQWFQAGVSPAHHVDEVVSVLNRQPPPYLIVASYLLPASDPISQLIAQQYVSVSVPGMMETGELPSFYLYRRKDLPPPAEDGRG